MGASAGINHSSDETRKRQPSQRGRSVASSMSGAKRERSEAQGGESEDAGRSDNRSYVLAGARQRSRKLRVTDIRPDYRMTFHFVFYVRGCSR